MKLFTPFQHPKLKLKNRLIMPPMCTYSAQNGLANAFHFAHYSARAIGQVGLIIVEATGVSTEGRITEQCLGLYADEQIAPLKQIVTAVHQLGSKIAIQLNHAGRKCKVDAATIYAPSAIAFDENSPLPKALTAAQINQLIHYFVAAADRANQAGFDAIEIHAAHGYLLSEFISPITNRRNDIYQNPKLILTELITAIKTVWPADKAILIRISATDYEEFGYDIKHIIDVLTTIQAAIDIIHVSSGGITSAAPAQVYPAYQVPFAKQIQQALRLPVIAVGMLNTPELAEQVLVAEELDLVAVGRYLLRNPNWLLEAYFNHQRAELIPPQYTRGYY